MLLWVIIVVLVLILIDVVRLHRKVDRLYNYLNPMVQPTDEEIEKLLTSKNDSLE